ncbi:MAG TPA: type III-B CRISPR module-associated protein Cmr3 [Alphaproteobacteria bacterium]|nr:type III-B CRISPR module-associated protein Cmr3 [Alphaproteobacteria bacterium]
MYIFIEPSDVLLFRDGRPFVAGEDHRAVSLFPPTPLTIQGAIRSRVLADKGVSYAAYASGAVSVPEIGYADNYGQVRLQGPFIARQEDRRIVRYFPLPADVVLAGCPQPITLAPLPASDSSFESSPPLSAGPSGLLWHRTIARLEALNGWLSEVELGRYLKDKPFKVTPEHELFERESRFHVGIDSRFKRPHQGDSGGHLFQVEFMRLRYGVGLWLDVSGVQLRDEGLLQLGGDAKAAMYRKVDDAPLLTPGGTIQGKFRLYFATPAYFANGWQPSDWGQFIRGGRVRLVAAALSRAQPIGGFDLARSQHKPMRRFVPSGSVFFFESDDMVTVPDAITDDDGQARLSQIGFGQVFIGGWDYV